jgi:hypothetical protein
MKKKINILIMFVLIGALAGAGVLVRNNQNTQRGATFASVEALFLPETKALEVGDKLVTTLMIDAKTHMITGGDLRVKFDAEKLNLESVAVFNKDISTVGNPWTQSEGDIIMSEIDNTAGTFTLVGAGISNKISSLSTGVVSVVKLNFVAKSAGTATVKLDSNYANIVTGYNSAGSDQELKIEKVSEATYKIVGVISVEPTKATVKCGWCGTSCVDISQQSGACTMVYVEGKECVNKAEKCVIVPILSEPTVVLKKKVTVMPTKTRMMY